MALLTPLAGPSAAAVLTIAGGIATDGGRSKALLIAGAASSAGAAILRKRGHILSLKEENKQHRDSAAAALQKANSLEEQINRQRQIAKNVIIRKIEDVEEQLLKKLENTQQEKDNSKKLDEIHRLLVDQLHFKKQLNKYFLKYNQSKKNLM